MNHPSGKQSQDHTVFLSFTSLDREAARAVVSGLRTARIDVWWDEGGIGWGDDWQGKLEEALSRCGAYLILLGTGGVRRWVKPELGVALRRHVDDGLPILPLLLDGVSPESMPPFLSLFQARRLPADLDAFDFEALAAELRATAAPTVPPVIDACPFPGLVPFEEDAADFFLGRQSDTLALLARLGRGVDGLQRRWLQVEGPSGVGKSSLVRAGLIPAVRAGWLEEGATATAWTVIVLRPGGQPLEALAAALERAFGTAQVPATVFQRLEALRRTRGDEADLRYLLKVAFAGDSRLLLVIDQFEELFTLTADPETLARTDALLASAVEDTDGSLYLVTTIRSDFLLRIGELPRLQGLLNARAGRYDLQPLSLAGYREIVRIPVQRAGLKWSEPSLPDRIVEDAIRERAPLPLVANLLRLLWKSSEKRGDRVLRAEDYQALNGVAGALAKGGDRLLASLGPDGEKRARRLLLALVKPGEESQDTKQPISRPMALEAAGGGSEAEHVLNRLSGLRGAAGQAGNDTDPRLVVVSAADSDRPGEQSYRVDLAHEALLRLDPAGKPYWKTLRDWIDDNREQLRRRELIRGRMRTWREDGEPPDRLLAAERELEDGRALLAGAKDVPIGDIVPYVQRSIARAEGRRRHTRLSLVAVFVMLSTALILTVQQWRHAARQTELLETANTDLRAQRSLAESERLRAEQKTAEADSERTQAEQRAVEADRQANLARAREIAIRAESMLDGSIGSTSLAGALAVESLRSADTIDGRHVLAKVMALTPRGVQPVDTPWRYSSLRYSPAGDLVLKWTHRGSDSSPASGSVSLVDPATLEPLDTHEMAGLVWPAFSPDGTWMAISGYARRLLIIDLELRGVELDLRYKTQIDARFSADGERLFVARADGVLETRTAPDWSLESERRFADPNADLGGIALSVPAADEPLVVDATTAAFILPPGDGPALRLKTQAGGTVRLALIDRAGQRAFTSEWRKVATLWDARSGAKIAALEQGDEVQAAAFSADGSRLATANEDGEVVLWDAASGDQLTSFSVGESATSVDFSPDGTMLAAGGENGDATVWDLGTKEKMQAWSHDTPVWEVAFGQDGRSLLIGDDSKVLRRVDLATGRELARRCFSGNVSSISRDPDSGVLAVGVRRSDHAQSWLDMRAIDPRSGELQWTLEHNGDFSPLVFNPDGRTFATTTNRDDKLKIWNAETGVLSRALVVKGHSPTYTADGKRLVLHGYETEVFDAGTGERLGLIGEPGGVDGAAFLKVEGLLVTYGLDRTLRAWDVGTGREVWRRTLPARPVFSPDGRRYLLTGSSEPWRIFDTLTGRREAEIPRWGQANAHNRSSSTSPDGRRLLRFSHILPDSRTGEAPYEEMELWDLEKGVRLFADRYDGVASVEGRFLPGDKVQVLDKYGALDVLDGETGARLWGIPEFRSDKELRRYMRPERADEPLVVTGKDFTELRDQQTGTVLARYDKPLKGRILADDPALMVAAEFRFIYQGSPDRSLAVMLMDWRTGRERWNVRLPLDISGGGAASIRNLVPSPDGKRLLVHTAGHRAQLTILDPANGDVLGTIETDSDWRTFWPLADPDLVLAWDWSSTVRVWRLSTGKEVHRFAHTHTAMGVSVAEDSGRSVTYRGGSLRVWDLGDLSQVAARQTDGEVEKIAIRPDGRQVAYVTARERKSDSGASFDGLVLWNLDSESEPQIVPIETDIGDIVYDSTGTRLAARIGQRGVRVWDVETLRPVLTVEALPDAKVHEVSFSADGARLFVRENAQDFGYRIWDIATGREIARLDGSQLLEVPDSTDILLRHKTGWRQWDIFSGHFETRPWPKSAWSLQISADGGAVTTHDKESFYSIDVETGAMRSLQPIPSDEELTAYRLSARGDLLVSSQRKLDPYRPGAVSLRRLPGGDELAHTNPDAVITMLAFADGDDSLIFVGTPGWWAIHGSGTSLFLWRWRTGEIKTLSEDQSIHAIAVSPDGDYFVTGEGGRNRDDDPMKTVGTPQIRVWDARTGRLLRTLPLDELVYDLAFSPDGTFLAARQAGKVRILDPSSDWTEAQVLSMHYGTNRARVHLGAGNRVIVSDAKGYYRDGVAGIRVWYPDGKLEHLLRTNRGFVPLALSQVGRAVAARDGDLLRVWDLDTGTELTRHRFSEPSSFAFAGKDDHLFVRTESRTDVLEKVPWRLEDVIEDACRRLQRELDEDEQQRYLRRVSDGAGCPSRSAAVKDSASQP